MRKPYYVKRLKCWYFKGSDRKEIRLHPDEEAAYKLWQDYLDCRKFAGTEATVAGLLDEFIDQKKAAFSDERYKVLVNYATSFVKFCTAKSVRQVSAVTVQLVAEWLASPQPGRGKADGSRGEIRWKPNTQRQAAALLKRAWKWAHNAGHIRANTMAELSLPSPEYRTEVLTEELHSTLVNHCLQRPDARAFALYLIASRCGARPQQIREVTVSHVSPDKTCWVFEKHKTRKKTGKPLVIYLPPCLQTLTRILMQRRRQHLFLNSHGNPWKKDTVVQRFERLRVALDLPPGTVAYLYRHTLITDALLAGHSAAIVAQLAGHTDTRMVSQVYGHLGEHRAAMVQAMAEVRRRE